MREYTPYTYTPNRGSMKGRVFSVRLAEHIPTPALLTKTPQYIDATKHKEELNGVMAHYYSLVDKYGAIAITEITPRQRKRRIVLGGYDPNNTFRKVAKQFLIRMVQHDPFSPAVEPRAELSDKIHKGFHLIR